MQPAFRPGRDTLVARMHASAYETVRRETVAALAAPLCYVQEWYPEPLPPPPPRGDEESEMERMLRRSISLE